MQAPFHAAMPPRHSQDAIFPRRDHNVPLVPSPRPFGFGGVETRTRPHDSSIPWPFSASKTVRQAGRAMMRCHSQSCDAGPPAPPSRYHPTAHCRDPVELHAATLFCSAFLGRRARPTAAVLLGGGERARSCDESESGLAGCCSQAWLGVDVGQEPKTDHTRSLLPAEYTHSTGPRPLGEPLRPRNSLCHLLGWVYNQTASSPRRFTNETCLAPRANRACPRARWIRGPWAGVELSAPHVTMFSALGCPTLHGMDPGTLGHVSVLRSRIGSLPTAARDPELGLQVLHNFLCAGLRMPSVVAGVACVSQCSTFGIYSAMDAEMRLYILCSVRI